MSATVKNCAGIHCRPAGVITEKLRNYDGTILVRRGAEECDPQSILDLMAMALEEGSDLTIQVSGQDEESMCQMLVELFETHFDYPPQQSQ